MGHENTQNGVHHRQLTWVALPCCYFLMLTNPMFVHSWQCRLVTGSLKLLHMIRLTLFLTLLINLCYYQHLLVLFTQERDSCLDKLNCMDNWKQFAGSGGVGLTIKCYKPSFFYERSSTYLAEHKAYFFCTNFLSVLMFGKYLPYLSSTWKHGLLLAAELLS